MSATPTDTVDGTQYIHALASYIRQHESKLADFVRKGPAPTAPSWTTILTLGIVAGDVPVERKPPLILRFDPHHLYYLLLKFDEVGIPGIGSLDVRIEGGTSRPMSVDYGGAQWGGAGGGAGGLLTLPDSDLRSIRSGMSSFSLGSGWWGASAPPPDESIDVKYLYSSCTKLPALRLSPFSFSSAPPARNSTPTLQKPVKDFEDCPPPNTAVPLYAFKNLQSLILEDLDPRGFLGWDVLSIQLKSLELHGSGVEDLGELVCDAVVEDLERRSKGTGGVGEERRRRQASNLSEATTDHGHAHAPKDPFDDLDFWSRPHSPASGTNSALAAELSSYPIPPRSAWSQLRHLSLSHNSLTFIPGPPLAYLPTLTSLDLSSNLLISVPPGLSHLHSLRSLNLSDNMIDSLVGVSKALGAIAVVNLSRNRLENLSGLDRLFALERIDVRENRLREALEVSRLAVLPCLKEVWIEGNPFTKPVVEGGEEGYRVKCFNYFAKEGKEGVTLDGTGPGMNERRGIVETNGKAKSRRASFGATVGGVGAGVGTRGGSEEARTAGAAKVVGRRVVTTPHSSRIRSQRAVSPPPPLPTDSGSPSVLVTSPTKKSTTAAAKPRHRKPRRIVDLDGGIAAPSSVATGDSGTSGMSDSDHASSSGADAHYHQHHHHHARPVHELSTAQEEEESGANNPSSSSTPSKNRHTRYPTSPVGSAAPSLHPTHSSRSLGASTSKSSRRDRVSLSTYEPPTSSGSHDVFGQPSTKENSGEAFRKRIEALRNEVGESWLSVLGERELAAERSKSQSEESDAGKGKGKAQVVPSAATLVPEPSRAEAVTVEKATNGNGDGSKAAKPEEAEETKPVEAPKEQAEEQESKAVFKVVSGKGKKKKKKKKSGGA